jgi:gluconokinase
MSEPLILTLDMGTSSARVLLWDVQGNQVEEVHAQRRYSMHTTPDGGVEMPIEELTAYVETCLDQAIAQAGERASAIRAIGISTFWHSFLGLDAAGRPLTPLYSWADTRSAAVCRRLRQTLDADAIYARTGCVLHPSYYPARLVWLRETQPELYARVARWVSPSEYLFRRWFGESACRISVSMASGTGLLDQAQCVWDIETLAALNVPVEALSSIADLSEAAQGLQPEFASRWPALREVPFFPAVGDGACGNVGSGCTTPDRFAINLGTSGAIRALWREGEESAPRIPAQKAGISGLWRYRVDTRRPMLGAAFSDGGNVYLWLRCTLQLPSPEEIEAQIAAMEPGAHGLTTLPFLAGERSLGWNPDARAALLGMNLDTSPIEIVRAEMEAIAMQFASAAERLRAVFPEEKEVIASGGVFGNSPAWAQIFADALGQPLTLAEEPEASSRGAALLAMEAGGLIPDVASLPAHLGRVFLPDPTRQARYHELRARQQAYYRLLMESGNPL